LLALAQKAVSGIYVGGSDDGKLKGAAFISGGGAAGLDLSASVDIGIVAGTTSNIAGLSSDGSYGLGYFSMTLGSAMAKDSAGGCKKASII